MNRAYSLLNIKSIDDAERVITGIATNAGTDRDGDVVDPKGATFTLPLPLLWQHNAREPIGEVFAAKVTSDGIEIKARIAKVNEPGRLKDRIDEAWHSMSSTPPLVRGLSIGFKPLEAARIEGTFGSRFSKWLWLELSAVTIPANAGALVHTIKSIAEIDRAALGEGLSGVVPPSTGGSVSLKSARQGARTSMKTYAEQITALEAKRAANTARMTEIQSKASDDGRTKDETEKEEFTTLKGEIEKIDAELVDLRDMEKLAIVKATPVNGGNAADGSASRSNGSSHVISVKSNLPPGFGFARMVRVKMAAFMERTSAADIAKQWYPDDRMLHLALKAAVGAATTTDTDYASALVYAQNMQSEFIEFLRPATIIGKFGTNGIPGLRNVPFNIRMVSQTSGGDGYWVGEGKPKPLTAFDFAPASLGFSKVAAIAVITKELGRFSSPGAEGIIRDALKGAIVGRIDTDFINPSKAAVSNVSPASITNGLTPMTSAGTSADNVRTDVAKMLKTFLDDNHNPTSAVFIMPPALAMSLGLMRNSLGNKEFPDLTMNGGSLEGIPVITTQYAALTGGPGNLVILLNASDIFLADDGNVTVDVSDQASLEMLDSALVQDGTIGTGTSLVSLWQNNLLGLLAEREIAWKKRRAEAVVYMDDVNWGSIGSPA